jgi:hypothetical protein
MNRQFKLKLSDLYPPKSALFPMSFEQKGSDSSNNYLIFGHLLDHKLPILNKYALLYLV